MTTVMTDCGGLKTVKIDLLRRARVIIEVEFASEYEAAIAYQDMSETLAAGRLAIEFCGSGVKATTQEEK